jgi:hypothetical protein
MYKLPLASMATPFGELNLALVAGPLSPLNPKKPLPARVRIMVSIAAFSPKRTADADGEIKPTIRPKHTATNETMHPFAITRTSQLFLHLVFMLNAFSKKKINES